MDQWFVEEARPLVARDQSKWAPAIYHGEKPKQNRVEGSPKRFRADPVKINKGYHRCTVAQIAEVYGKDGRFHSQTRT